MSISNKKLTFYIRVYLKYQELITSQEVGATSKEVFFFSSLLLPNKFQVTVKDRDHYKTCDGLRVVSI